MDLAVEAFLNDMVDDDEISSAYGFINGRYQGYSDRSLKHR